MESGELHPFERGIEQFNRGDYFEAHETWEAIWTAERGPRRLFLQALIHIAVAGHHHAHGNSEGATGQLAKGLRKLAGYLPVCEGIDTWALWLDCQRRPVACIRIRRPLRV